MRTFVLFALIFIIGCAQTIDKIDNVECSSDADCAVAGCSSQICTTKESAPNIITTCEYKEEYSCYKETSCSCINSKCQWKENEGFRDCLENVN